MKVLIISHSFPPSNAAAAQRPFFLAKELQKMGHHPIVLTPKEHYSSLGTSDWADISDINVVYTKNVNLSFAHKASSQRAKNDKPKSRLSINSFFKRSLKKVITKILPHVMIPDKAFLWPRYANKEAFKIWKNHQPDIVFSTSPSVANHLIAYKLKKKFGVKWVADFRDFYYTGNVEFKKSLRKIFDRRIERKILKNADYSTFISKGMKDYYINKNKFISDKTMAVYNGYDADEAIQYSHINISSTKLKIFYAGSFYNGLRSPIPLFKALDHLVKTDQINIGDFEIEVAGHLNEEMIDQLSSFKSKENLKLLGVIPRKEVLAHLRRSHLLWLIVGNHISHYLGFPVKGYEYISAKRPLLVFAPKNSEAEKIITNLDCGSILDVDDNQETIVKNSEKLLQYFVKHKTGELNRDLNLDQNKLKMYSRQYQSVQFKDIFSSL